MLTMQATITNNRQGRYEAYAFLAAQREAEEGKRPRDAQLGRLDMQRTWPAMAEALAGVKQIAELLRAQLVTLDWSEREYAEDDARFTIKQVHHVL